MLDVLPGKQLKTFAAGKAYDTRDFIQAGRPCNAAPHVASNDTRIGGSVIDGRTGRAQRLLDQPEDPKEDRGALWLGQDGGQDQADRHTVHTCSR